MAGHVTVAVQPDSRTQVLRLNGDLDIVTVDACRAELDAALADISRRASDRKGSPPPSAVVLDLSAVPFLSAAGLRMLSDTARRLAQQQIAVLLAVPEGAFFLHRLVHLAGLDREMTVVDGPFPVRTAAHRPRPGASVRSSAKSRGR